MNVVSMGLHTNDGKLMGVRDMLLDSLKDVETEGSFESRTSSALILFLDSSNGNYSVGFRQCGMTMTQCIALAEVAKVLLLQEINYIPRAIT